MDYVVEVTSTFETEDGEDSMTVTCPAMYRYTPERRLIRYDEYTDEGACMHTRVVSTSDGVDIIREGNRALDLRLRPGQCFSQEYNVGYGMVTLEYVSRGIEDCLNEQGGTLTVKYKMDIGGVGTFNTVVMSVRKTEAAE
ncbi:MAG: DUF1934 domain-containing protein [Clostridia bacterium]|nr:DUF1934 domain-containing protein [Clostridia bacterium]